MFSNELRDRTERLIERCAGAGLMLVTAESCTGGMIAGCLTEISGSSRAVERGFVTYSNEAKVEVLGVPMRLILDKGAVSAEVAERMASGALAASRADLAVSATGIAGPGGATDNKPVGLVYLGCCRRGGAPVHERHVFSGDRDAVRMAAVSAALDLLGRHIELQ